MPLREIPCLSHPQRNRRGRRLGVEGLESRRLLAIQITQFPVTGTSPDAQSITEGPDGNLWFGDESTSSIGVFNPVAQSTVYIPTPTLVANPLSITTAPDGNLWFTESPANNTPQIATVNPTNHNITEYPLPLTNMTVLGIAADPSGNLWMTEPSESKIAEFDPTTQAFTEYATPTAASQPRTIILGPGGQLWFTEFAANKIGEINPTTHAISEFTISGTGPNGITVGPDGNLWYTASKSGAIGWLNPTTHTTGSVATPTSGSFPLGIAVGPGGDLSFTEESVGKIGVIDPSTKAIREYTGDVHPLSFPAGMTTGPGGNPWFVTNNSIGEVQDLPGTTTALDVSPNPAYYTSTVVLTAAVTPISGLGTPAGVVDFFDGTTSLGTAILNGSGRATLDVSTLSLGSHTITADFTGGPGFAQSTSSPVTESIVNIPTTISIAASPDPASYGQTIDVVATISVPAGVQVPPGYVDLHANGNEVGFSAVYHGQTVLRFTPNSPGQFEFVAFFNPLSIQGYESSTSAPLSVTVTPAASAVQLVVSPNPQTTGRPVTLTATVTSPAPYPDGMVTFFDGTTVLGTGFVNYTAGQAALTLPSLSAGLHDLSAVFSSTTGFAPSVSNVVSEQIIAVPATTTTLYPYLNPSPIDKPLLLTATVAPTAGVGTPTGAVAFFADGDLIGTVPVGADGRAELLTAALTQADSNVSGTIHDLIASYSGDGTFSPSVSPTIRQTLGPPDGPEVFSLARIGPSGSASALVFTFNEALHPATAQDASNYVIVGPNGRRVPIKSAVYDSTTQSVTVTPRSTLAANSTYVLTVIGVGPTGVTDVDGRFLDGEYVGHPGSNYSTAIVPRKLTLSRSVPAGPKVNARAAYLAALRAETAAYRASLIAARHHR